MGSKEGVLRRLHAAAFAVAMLSSPIAAGDAPLPEDDWPHADPASQNLDPEPLDRLVAAIEQGRDYPAIHSLLVVRHGYLVLERYFEGWHEDRLHTLQSVSKSITSALIGIAIDRGDLRGIDERVLDFFPDASEVRHLDDRKRAMTIEDLLTMRSGTDYHERGSGSPHDQLNSLRRGWDRFYLDRPMVAGPGTTFQYDSGGVILLSSLLKARTGLHADAYAERHLFSPLGIREASWFRNAEGHPHTGGGLDLRPRDMARFGLLYLRGGRWGDRQVVSSDWVARSTRRQVERRREPHDVGYGYLWWILEPDPRGDGDHDIYAAKGFRGQYIFVVPEHDMVVVVTAGTSSYAEEVRPERFLYTHILASVRR